MSCCGVGALDHVHAVHGALFRQMPAATSMGLQLHKLQQQLVAAGPSGTLLRLDDSWPESEPICFARGLFSVSVMLGAVVAG
ncbi:cc-nbs-lrr resistance protein [Anopheles sinensis]|uniref:Cc-nbs-lrr resistance protein n=1 Tax=Anopheles sinensis TaxID=74873 RepID=A0A084VHT0_ANOSI|nr:cc-nbs-lrr resistance protein [Anopheles sinensis]